MDTLGFLDVNLASIQIRERPYHPRILLFEESGRGRLVPSMPSPFWGGL